MAEQLLRDANIEPTDEVIAAALGEVYDAYATFAGGLAARDVQVQWRYYNDGKSWLGKCIYAWTTSRGTSKEATMCWLSVWEGFFRVGIMIPAKHQEGALALPLSDAVRDKVQQAEQPGKMKTIPLGFDLCDDSLFADLYALIDFKKQLK